MCSSTAQQLLLFSSLILFGHPYNTARFLEKSFHLFFCFSIPVNTHTHTQASIHIHYLFTLLIFMIHEHLQPKMSSISFHAILFFCLFTFVLISVFYSTIDVVCRIQKKSTPKKYLSQKYCRGNCLMLSRYPSKSERILNGNENMKSLHKKWLVAVVTGIATIFSIDKSGPLCITCRFFSLFASYPADY